MLYRSTETYTVVKVNPMGVDLNEVYNSQNMLVAILTDEDFALQYEEVPLEVTPHE